MKRQYRNHSLACGLAVLLVPAALVTHPSPAGAQGTTIYVKVNGNDANNGLSWDKPKRHIQAAIDAAPDGGEVDVYDGKYSGVGNRDLIIGDKALRIHSANGWKKVTIDCGGTANGFYLNWDDRSETSITGFTFTRFDNGIYLQEAGSPTIRNCRFLGPGNVGIYTEDSYEPLIDACIFTGPGEGIFSTWSMPTLNKCTFSGSTCGLEFYHNGIDTATDCVFTANGIGAYGGETSGQFVRCEFSHNTGSGLYATFSNWIGFDQCIFQENGGVGLGLEDHSYWPISNCQFIRNRGAGLYISSFNDGLRDVVTDNQFLGNGGGGLIVDGHPDWGDFTQVLNCSFVGNAGNAISWIVAEGVITNCTATRNAAGIVVTDTNDPDLPLNLRITNCVLWQNVSSDLAGFSATYSDIGAGVVAGAHNFSANPVFVKTPAPGLDTVWGTADDNYGDLHLNNGSPCFNAGSLAAPYLPSTDQAGYARVVNGLPDLGALETRAKLTTLSPKSAPKGGPSLTMSASGTLFSPGAKVYWEDTALTTTFVSSKKLTSVVPAGLLSVAGTFHVKVVNPTGDFTATTVFTVTP